MVADLEGLVGGEARGDPESPLRWTAKSVRALAVRCASRAIASAMKRSPSCCAGLATAYKIEHRLFSYIARNWHGQPLVSRQAVVSLIAATTSTPG